MRRSSSPGIWHPSGATRTPLAPAARALLLFILLLLPLVGGCQRDDSAVPVVTWTLLAGRGETQVTLPTHVGDRVGDRAQTYHLRASVAVPAPLRGRPLTLVIPHLWAPVSLSVRGREMAALEPVADPKRRPLGHHAFVVPAGETGDEALLLDLAVSHSWTQSAWLDTVPYLTAMPYGGARYSAIRAISTFENLMGIGSVLTVSLVYGIVFLLDRRRTAQGWFAAQGFAASLYCFFVSSRTEALLGSYDAAATLFGLSVAIFVSIHFTRTQFRLPPPTHAWTAVIAVSLVASVVWRGPFATTPYLAPLVVGIIVLGIVNQIVMVLGIALRQNAPRNANVVLVAWLVLAVLAANDLAAWAGLGDHLGGLRLGCIGVACFGLLQSVALSRDFLGSLTEMDRLNVELQGKMTHLAEQTAAVADLNHELRRQVLARSEQLSDALTRLAGAHGEAVVLKEGDVVEDQYEVVRVVGAGGMGVVYEVRRTRDDVRLALKVLSGTVGVREMARFAREAKLAATVHDANVVTILDVAVSSKGFLFLVLELVEGDPLQRRRERFGDVPWALRVLHGIVKGLAAIHREGIVHRDLKPANVLVREDATGTPTTVKITDFGISNAAPTSSGGSIETPEGSEVSGASGDGISGSEDPTAPARPNPAAAAAAATGLDAPPTKDHGTTGSGAGEAALVRPAGPLTQTGMILGTPAYMAPEVMRSARSSSTASDVYSFGVLAFELIHARRPFSEAQAAARAFGHFDAEGPPMEPLGVPAPLAAALAAALAIDPLERPTAAALERMLEDAQTA